MRGRPFYVSITNNWRRGAYSMPPVTSKCTTESRVHVLSKIPSSFATSFTLTNVFSSFSFFRVRHFAQSLSERITIGAPCSIQFPDIWCRAMSFRKSNYSPAMVPSSLRRVDCIVSMRARRLGGEPAPASSLTCAGSQLRSTSIGSVVEPAGTS